MRKPRQGQEYDDVQRPGLDTTTRPSRQEPVYGSSHLDDINTRVAIVSFMDTFRWGDVFRRFGIRDQVKRLQPEEGGFGRDRMSNTAVWILQKEGFKFMRGDSLGSLKGERFNGWGVYIGFKKGDTGERQEIHLVQSTEIYADSGVEVTIWALVDPEKGYVKANKLVGSGYNFDGQEGFVGFSSREIWISVHNYESGESRLLPLHTLLGGDSFAGVFFLFPKKKIAAPGGFWTGSTSEGREVSGIMVPGWGHLTLVLHEIGHKLLYEEFVKAVGDEKSHWREGRVWSVFLERAADAFRLSVLRALGVRGEALYGEVLGNLEAKEEEFAAREENAKFVLPMLTGESVRYFFTREKRKGNRGRKPFFGGRVGESP